MFLGGVAWITSANTLSVSIQMGLPDWVRARGMSIYQMAIFGSQRQRCCDLGSDCDLDQRSTQLGHRVRERSDRHGLA